MAGGSGTRFWPLSRKRIPKQVLSILGPNSMLQETVARLIGIVPTERTFIVTNAQQKKVIVPQLPMLSDENYLIEPSARNTAPCIGLAALHLRRTNPDAVMIVLPSDHLVKNVSAFQKAVRTAAKVAVEQDALVTFGIPPTRPETGYGYIQFGAVNGELPKGVHRVKAFAEKPNKDIAQGFVDSGEFYWNSGIFVWKASRIIREMEEHLPDMMHQLHLIDRASGTAGYKRALRTHYSGVRPISIDYGVMEHTRAPIFMVEGSFGWSDVGSWDELYRQHKPVASGNVVVGEGVTLDAAGSFIHSPDRLTAVIGLSNILVINTKNTVLICPLDRAQDVKQIVDKLQREGKEKYL